MQNQEFLGWIKIVRSTLKINLEIFNETMEPLILRERRFEYEAKRIKVDQFPLYEPLPGQLLREFEWAKQEYSHQIQINYLYLAQQRQIFDAIMQEELKLVLSEIYNNYLVDEIIKYIKI